MKTMKTRNGLIITICALLFAALTFYSCDSPIGLGSKLNMDPPIVTIIEPDFMQNIKGNTLTIKGKANDLDEIAYLNITIEKTKGAAWKKELLSTRGSWSVKSANTAWTAFNDGTWEIVQKGLVIWSVDVPMDDAAEGEYIISAGAENNVKNAGPVSQRRVTIDKTPPVVNIILPVLEWQDKEDNTSYLTHVKPDFDARYKFKDTTVLDMLHTRSIKIQYEVKDNFSISAFELMLADHEGNFYYHKSVDNSGWSGAVTVLADEIKDSTGNIINEKTYLQIISKATDKAGNDRYQSHGWLVWWPDADIPWAESVGDTTDNGASGTQVYPGSVVYGQAYDNQGVKSVTYRVFGYNGSIYNVVTGITGTLLNQPLQEDADPSMFFSFNFKAPEGTGRYMVETVTEDIYGNKGTDKFYFYVYEINVTGPLLVSFGGSPTGLYGLDAVINITLYLREPVTITSPVMTLNVNKTPSTAATADFDISSNGTAQLKFTYTVQAGDSVPELNVVSITSSNLTKPGGAPLLTTDNLSFTQGLDFYTRIEISTDVPVLQSASFNQTTLTLTFSKSISKGTGEITLTQQGTLLAPAVLTKTEYNRFGGAALSSYYTAGINGTDASGNPDTSEKYILNYNLDTNDGSLITALTNGGAFKVTVPVASSAVTVSGNSLTVDLSATYGYAPRVKGVSYAITYPAGLVRDNQNNQVQALTGTSQTFSNPGVNPPFIRVEKKRETFSTSGNILNPTITQVPSSDSYWIKDASFVIQAAKPAGDNWVEVPAFVIGTLTGDYRSFTGVMQAASPGALYIQGTKNEGTAVQNGRGRIHGTLYQNNTTFRTSWNGQGGYNNVDGNADQLWVNPYENTMTPWDGNWSVTGFLVGVENQPSMWINTNTGTKYYTQTANCIYIGKMVDQLNYATAAMTKNVTAVQPLSVGVKIDCQTPGATVRYSYNSTTGNPYAGQFGLPSEAGHPSKISVAMPGTPTIDPSTTPLTLGNAANLNGYMYAIRAEAVNGGNTAQAYEKAVRSVIMFNDIQAADKWNTLRTAATGQSRQLQLWLRGGDDKSGSSLTPNFPLSWSDTDYAGARLMAGIADNGTWYWVTWEVSTQAYFHFIAGTTSTTAEAAKGPLNWSWAKNNWAFQHEEYPLYPGGCLVFRVGTQVTHPASVTFEFYETFSGSRP